MSRGIGGSAGHLWPQTGQVLWRVLLLALLLALLGAVPVPAQPDPAAILQGLRVDRSRAIDFHAARFPDTVYVGEQVTYQVAVLLSESARARLRRNPEFVPPEFRGMLAFELGRPVRRSAAADGVPYEAYVFQRALFPVTAGQLGIPAPSLTYALPQSASFYSRETREVVRAESLTVVVRPLPVEGRPPRYAGAVGRLRVSARLDTAGLQVGLPVVFTVRVEGTGNIRLLPRPELEVPWGSAVPGTERLVLDTAGPLVRGAKEFEWILTPANAGAHVLPPVRYPVFDPGARDYRVVVTESLSVMVAPGVSVPGDREDNAVAPLDPLRPWRAGGGDPQAVRLERHGPWWVGLALLLPVVAVVAFARGGARRTKRGHPQAPMREAMGGGLSADETTAGGEARRRRRLLMDAVAARLGVPHEALVGREAFARALRHHGVSRTVTDLALVLRDQLEAEGFGPDTQGLGTARNHPLAAGMAADEALAAVLDRIDVEAVPTAGMPPRAGRRGAFGRSRRGTARLVVLALLVGTLVAVHTSGSLGAHAPLPRQPRGTSPALPDGTGAEVAATVAAAERAYADRHFREAAAGFADAAARAPQDVALLANWGTAAWAAGDTVSAVIAWQRAARLQPWAADLQRNLARLPPGARIGVASVPLVPVAAALLAALATWGVAWGWLAWWAWRREVSARVPRGALLLVMLALGLAAWGSWGRRRLSPHALAVVVRPETLRGAPTASAAAAGGVGTGDVVAAAPPRDGWVRVRHADGRTGWIPAGRVRPLLPGPRAE